MDRVNIDLHLWDISRTLRTFSKIYLRNTPRIVPDIYETAFTAVRFYRIYVCVLTLYYCKALVTTVLMDRFTLSVDELVIGMQVARTK